MENGKFHHRSPYVRHSTYWGVGALRNGTGTDRVVDTVVFVLTKISRIFEGYLG